MTVFRDSHYSCDFAWDMGTSMQQLSGKVPARPPAGSRVDDACSISILSSSFAPSLPPSSASPPSGALAARLSLPSFLFHSFRCRLKSFRFWSRSKNFRPLCERDGERRSERVSERGRMLAGRAQRKKRRSDIVEGADST